MYGSSPTCRRLKEKSSNVPGTAACLVELMQLVGRFRLVSWRFGDFVGLCRCIVVQERVVVGKPWDAQGVIVWAQTPVKMRHRSSVL